MGFLDPKKLQEDDELPGASGLHLDLDTKTCPSCRREALPWQTECPDCGVPTVVLSEVPVPEFDLPNLAPEADEDPARPSDDQDPARSRSGEDPNRPPSEPDHTDGPDRSDRPDGTERRDRSQRRDGSDRPPGPDEPRR